MYCVSYPEASVVTVDADAGFGFSCGLCVVGRRGWKMEEGKGLDNFSCVALYVHVKTINIQRQLFISIRHAPLLPFIQPRGDPVS